MIRLPNVIFFPLKIHSPPIAAKDPRHVSRVLTIAVGGRGNAKELQHRPRAYGLESSPVDFPFLVCETSFRD